MEISNEGNLDPLPRVIVTPLSHRFLSPLSRRLLLSFLNPLSRVLGQGQSEHRGGRYEVMEWPQRCGRQTTQREGQWEYFKINRESGCAAINSCGVH